MLFGETVVADPPIVEVVGPSVVVVVGVVGVVGVVVVVVLDEVVVVVVVVLGVVVVVMVVGGGVKVIGTATSSVRSSLLELRVYTAQGEAMQSTPSPIAAGSTRVSVNEPGVLGSHLASTAPG